MARCLIIGCGCRGRTLAGELVSRGIAVRGTTRQQSRLSDIESVGAEAHLGDPDRVATLQPALEHVTIACVLLGSATGADEDQLAALHSSRLEMLLTRMIDTTVHAIAYEATGSLPPPVLEGGARRVREACTDAKIPHALIEAGGDGHRAWLAAAMDALEGLLPVAGL